MKIPIKALKLMAQHLKLTHIIVFGYDGKSQHVATYGKSIEACAQSADFGNKLKDQLGWPESLHAQPSRVRALQARIKELEQQLEKPESNEAEKAVSHLIKRIQADPRLAWLISPMSESFGLLTRAYANIRGLDPDQFRKDYEATLKFERWPQEGI